MKLKKITLENFRCFDELPIEFNEKINVLIGNNGSGKSTILDGIAVGLGSISTYLPDISGISFKKKDIRVVNNQKKPYVKVSLETYEGSEWDRVQKRDKSKKTTECIPFSKGIKELRRYIDDNVLDNYNNSTSFEMPLYVYYGVSRAVLDIPLRRTGFTKKQSRFDALRNSLESVSRFRAALIWFYNKENEENRKQKENKNFNEKIKELDVVRRAIGRMFPELSEPHIEVNPLRFMIKKNGDFLSIDQLSDGYKTMLGLVVDLSSRFAMANAHLSDPLGSEAIVMIDEIDLHLHPSWQQRVIGDLMATFPNTQFILTTHSPYIIESLNNHLKKDKIKDLKINDSEIKALEPINQKTIKVYMLENNKLINIINEDLGLIDDKLLVNFNAINKLYDKMRDIEWAGVSD